jgi:hypothetical protein
VARSAIIVRQYSKEMEEEEVSDGILLRERETSQKLHKAFRKDEERWIKSKNLWLRLGDKNTTFFQKQSKAQR